MSGSTLLSKQEELDGDEVVPPTTPLVAAGEKIAVFNTENGLSNWQAGFLLFGATIGSGVFVVPTFFAKVGYVSFFIYILGYLQSHYCGVLLARCWVITKEHNPDYRETPTRFPYAVIANEALGSWGKWVVTISLVVYIFSVVVTFLLLLSDFVVTVLDELFPSLEASFCSLPPIMGAMVIPFMFFGTPNDFWLTGVLGSLSTVFAATFIALQCTFDANMLTRMHERLPTGRPVSFGAVCGFLGSLFFAVTIHPLYPTVQHDMSNQKHFSRTLAASNVAGGLVMLAVIIPTYIVYGESMRRLEVESVLQVLPDGLPRLLCSIAMTLHFSSAIIIVANPMNQQLEELLDIPTEFCWQRCAIRTAIIMLVIFTAESVPHFGVLIPFIGGTLAVLLSVLGPAVFYLRLYPKQTSGMFKWETRSMPTSEIILCFICAGLSPLLMIAIVYTGVDAIISSQSTFTVPCYVNASLAHS